MKENRVRCSCMIGSMTQAMRGQKALAGAAILADVIKANTGSSLRGCAYGLSYPCAQENNVKTVLTRAGVRVRSYQGGNSDLPG